MRTFNIGETVVVPRFERGEFVGHTTGTVTVHHTSADPASAFYLIRVQDREVGHYPHEMTRPRHLSDTPTDSGASATAPRTPKDPWAGNPDTDKHWSNR